MRRVAFKRRDGTSPIEIPVLARHSENSEFRTGVTSAVQGCLRINFSNLTAELNQQGDPRMSGRGRVFDEYPYAGERQRNFCERFMKAEGLTAGRLNPSDFEKPEND